MHWTGWHFQGWCVTSWRYRTIHKIVKCHINVLSKLIQNATCCFVIIIWFAEPMCNVWISMSFSPLLINYIQTVVLSLYLMYTCSDSFPEHFVKHLFHYRQISWDFSWLRKWCVCERDLFLLQSTECNFWSYLHKKKTMEKSYKDSEGNVQAR